jgi:hypothetical protein
MSWNPWVRPFSVTNKWLCRVSVISAPSSSSIDLTIFGSMLVLMGCANKACSVDRFCDDARASRLDIGEGLIAAFGQDADEIDCVVGSFKRGGDRIGVEQIRLSPHALGAALVPRKDPPATRRHGLGRHIAGGTRTSGRGWRTRRQSLTGNRSYSDLRGCGWGVVRTAHDIETKVIDRLKMADDVEAEISAFEEERATAFDDEPALWGLDVGVAAATIAISAYGAIPVSSCNAGAFGGRHSASYPYVAFFLPKDLAPEILRCAEVAGVGLLCDVSGLAQIYGQGEMDLIRFAEAAWKLAAGLETP